MSMLLNLKPLVVVTGTLHVEGGLTSQRRVTSDGTPQEDKRIRTTIVQDRDISDERKRAHVIFSTYSRKIKALRVLKTPFGVLIHPDRLPEVQTLLVSMTKRAAEFNQSSAVCKIENCLVWEMLAGNRKAAVEGWLSKRKAVDKDPVVLQVLPDLEVADHSQRTATGV